MDYSTVSLEQLRNTLTGSRRSAWVRAVVGPAGDDPVRVLALHVVIGPRPERWQDREWRYADCTFVAGRVTARRVAQWCKGGPQKFSLGSVIATIDFQKQQQLTAIHVPSLADYSHISLAWPAVIYTPAITDNTNINPPQSYLVGDGDVPSFPMFAGAFNAFFYDDYTLTGVGNQQLGATIHIVDQRAFIRKVRVRPASLHVWLGGSARRSATLELNSAGHRTVVPVGSSRLVIPLPDGLPADAWIWLKAGSEWIDFRPLTPWGGRLSPDIEVEMPHDTGAELSRLVTQGEGTHVEYKEKLPSNDTEKRTVFKTVVAFANGSGGTIVFGVCDEGGQVVGVAGDLAVQRRQLTDWVRELINPSPRIETDVATFDGRDVLLLRVHPGNGTIHALVLQRNKPEFYVRRDGTTYYARADDLNDMAGQRSSSGHSETLTRLPRRR